MLYGLMFNEVPRYRFLVIVLRWIALALTFVNMLSTDTLLSKLNLESVITAIVHNITW